MVLHARFLGLVGYGAGLIHSYDFAQRRYPEVGSSILPESNFLAKTAPSDVKLGIGAPPFHVLHPNDVLDDLMSFKSTKYKRSACHGS